MRALALLAAVLTSCAPTTFRAFCDEDAAARCTKAFQCDREAAEASWRTVQGCVDDLANAGDCRNAGTKACYLEQALTQRCLDDLEALSCEQRNTRPPSCAEVQCVDPREVRCEAADTTFANAGCERTRTQCSDGLDYRISCTATTCTCHRGANEGRDFDRGTFCEDGGDAQDAAFVTQCQYER